MAKKKHIPGTQATIHGFSRVMLKGNGEVVGDSGWIGPNMVVNGGIQQFLLNLVGKTTGSLQVAAMAVGSGTVPASNATTLDGEWGGTARRIGTGTGGWAIATTQRTASNATATLQFSGSWGSATYSSIGSSNISNIGLFDISTGAGSLFAGNTYGSSLWNTNQDLYASYQIRISFA